MRQAPTFAENNSHLLSLFWFIFYLHTVVLECHSDGVIYILFCFILYLHIYTQCYSLGQTYMYYFVVL